MMRTPNSSPLRPAPLPYWPTTADVMAWEARNRGASEIDCQEPESNMLQPDITDDCIAPTDPPRYAQDQHDHAPPCKIRRRKRPSTDPGTPVRREVIFEVKFRTYRLALLSEPIAQKVYRPTDTVWMGLATLLAVAGVLILYLGK